MTEARVALVSDLHGNALALEQVLARIRGQGIDLIICLGDVATLGPEPERTIELLRESRAVCLLGNHDEFMLRPETVESYTSIPILIDAIAWCRSRLSAASLEFIRGFKDTFRLPLSGTEELFAFHGTPSSNATDLLSTTPAPVVDEWMGECEATLLAGGHTHLPMLRRHRRHLLVNPGSVGMPFLEYVAGAPPTVLPYADYAVVEADAASVNVTLQRVALDKEALRKSVGNDNPLSAFLAAAYA